MSKKASKRFEFLSIQLSWLDYAKRFPKRFGIHAVGEKTVGFLQPHTEVIRLYCGCAPTRRMARRIVHELKLLPGYRGYDFYIEGLLDDFFEVISA